MTRTLRTLLCCTAVSLCMATAGKAQTFYRSYNITSPNSGGVEHVISTSDGGFLMLGSSNNDQLIIKTDGNGYVSWAKKLDASAGNTFMLNAVEAVNGGYFILYFAGNQEAVMKLSSAGNVVFSKKYSQTSGTAINSFGFCATYDGGFMMGGGNCGLVNYVTKCDSSGNYQWGKQFKNNYSPGTHTVHKIIRSTQGKYLALCDDPTSSNGGYACFEIDDAGQMSWYKKYMPTTADYHFPLQLIKHGDGYLIATAWKRQSQTETVYMTKIDAAGTPKWTKTYARPNKLQTAAMTVNNHGEVMIVGSEVATTNPRYLYFMTDSSGVVQWGKQSANITLQGAWGDNFLDVASKGSSFMLSGGTSGGRLTAALVSNTGAGMCNSTITPINSGSASATVTQPTITPVSFSLTASTIAQTVSPGVTHDSVFCSQGLAHQSVATTETSALHMYPNPAKDMLVAETGNSAATVCLQDISGRNVLKAVTTGKTTLDISGISNGLYMVVIYDHEGVIIARNKIMITH